MLWHIPVRWKFLRFANVHTNSSPSLTFPVWNTPVRMPEYPRHPSILTWQAITLALASVVRETTRSLASLRREPAFLQLKILWETGEDTEKRVWSQGETAEREIYLSSTWTAYCWKVSSGREWAQRPPYLSLKGWKCDATLQNKSQSNRELRNYLHWEIV